jgi:fructokinase
MTANNPTKNFDTLALGEALIDLISDGVVESLSHASHYQRFVGGQVTNLTINMARLGKLATLATCLGDDGLGQYIFHELKKASVITDFVQFTSEAPTAVSLIARQTKTPDFTIYRGADTRLTSTPALDDAVISSQIVHTSAFALSREPTRSTVLHALELASTHGKLVSLDPNYHPHIWPDVPDFVNTLQDACKFVHITKPSLDDCTRIFGNGHSPAEYAQRFLDWGLKTVIITMGVDGALLATDDGARFQIHPNNIPVSDVTGAGDAFWAGLLAAMVEGQTPLDAARSGQVIAEIKLREMGPISKMPTWEEIQNRVQTINYSAVD